jgi:hypothetical protein
MTLNDTCTLVGTPLDKGSARRRDFSQYICDSKLRYFKLPLYRLGQAPTVPGRWGCQISNSRYMKVVRLSALRTGCLFPPPHPRAKFLALNWVKGWVDPRAIVQPEGFGQWKILVNPSRIEPATFRFVAQCFKQLRHRMLQRWVYSCIIPASVFFHPSRHQYLILLTVCVACMRLTARQPFVRHVLTCGIDVRRKYNNFPPQLVAIKVLALYLNTICYCTVSIYLMLAHIQFLRYKFKPNVIKISIMFVIADVRLSSCVDVGYSGFHARHLL